MSVRKEKCEGIEKREREVGVGRGVHKKMDNEESKRDAGRKNLF